MALGPFTFIGAPTLVPIFEWELVDPRAYATVPPPPPPDCAGSDTANEASDPAHEPSDTWSLSEMRLVLKGWRRFSAADLMPQQAEADDQFRQRPGRDQQQDDNQALQSQRAADDAAARVRKAALAAYLQHLNDIGDLAKDLYTPSTEVDEGAVDSPNRRERHNEEGTHLEPGAHGPETQKSASEADLDATLRNEFKPRER